MVGLVLSSAPKASVAGKKKIAIESHDARQSFNPYRVVLIATRANGEQTAHLNVAGIGADDVRHRMAQGAAAVSTTDALNLFEKGWMEPLGWETQRLVEKYVSAKQRRTFAEAFPGALKLKVR